MKVIASLNAFSWYIKYFGIPITVVVTMHALFSRISQKKRKAALQGKVVVITGASSGIGEAMAHAFHSYGSKVVLAARRESELNRVKQEIIAKKQSAPTVEPVVVPLDLANLDSMDDFVKKVQEECGHIDILINNGGVSFRGSIVHTKIDVDKEIMNINYFGSVALTKAALPQMLERKSGHIIFVSSVQGLISIPDRSAYAASKHAMQAFGDGLRAELHQHNINVSVFSPGYIKTSISINALTGSGDKHAVMDTATATGYTAEYAADKVVDMTVNKKNELILAQFLPNMAIFIRKTSPSLYFWLMSRRANKTA